MTITELDALPAPEAERLFQGLCGSRGWAREMTGARPFRDRARLEESMRSAFDRLDDGAWLEAFAAHPRIGDVSVLRQKFASQEAGEQGSVAEASEEILHDLQRLNDAYFARHGFIFIIFASGKSASEMRDALAQRLPRSRAEEIAQAAREQRSITEHRLAKLLSPPSAKARAFGDSS